MAQIYTNAQGRQVYDNNGSTFDAKTGENLGAAPASSAGTLVKDPSTGAFTLSPGADQQPVRSVSDLGIGSGGTPAAPGASSPMDAYGIFNSNLMKVLAAAQGTGSTAPLYASRDQLQNQALNVSNPLNDTPYASVFRGMTPNAAVAAEKGTQAAFEPGITSINSQIQSENDAATKFNEMVQTAEGIAAPISVPAGTSLITKSGQKIIQGHAYTPTINPQTGLLDGFDTTTGTWASQDQAGNAGTMPGSTPMTGGGISGGASGGYNPIEHIFGSSNPIGAYATDPNYVQEISGLYNTVTKLGVTQSPDALQQYIKNNAGNAPVTGQMILNAAGTYGVDPALLTTVLLHESDFGTAGAATKTNNPGNIGNTGTSTQSYNSWQQGVNAAAANIAKRVAAAGAQPNANVAGASTQQQNATSPVGGSFSPDATTKIQQLPQAYQSYVDAGPLGVAYINDDRVPDNIKPGLQTMASRAGIPYVKDTDVGALKSIDTVLSNLDNMQTLAENNLGSGTLGHISDMTLGAGAQALQTGWGIQLGLFDNYRDVAIKAVQALAGGAGSGLRINMGEIAANTQNLPQASDSKENAVAQIKQLKQLIYTQLSTTFPYARVNLADPNGNTGTAPVGNLSQLLAKGYSIQ